MNRVASLYLPHWAIDRVRRAERRRAPPRPDFAGADLAPLAEAAAGEQALQCDAPRNTGWRPGARWARSDAVRPWSQTTRADVAEYVAALPTDRRPPMREMGRRSEPADHPFRAMPPDEGGGHARAASPIPASPHPGIRPKPGKEEPARPDPEDRPQTRWRGFDRLDPAADDRAAAALARWHAMPAIRYPGEGPRPDKHARHGSNDPHAAPPGATVFFDTGRSTAGTVARNCPERSPAPLPSARDAEMPLVTVRKVGSRVEIAAASPAAAALGIAPGMALTQARAAVPHLDVRDADPDGDAADLRRLAIALARRWCPVVAIADDSSLLLDITGTAHLHGGEEAMAHRLLRLLARLGVTAHIAIADTAGAAWAVGRYIGLVPSHAPRSAPTQGRVGQTAIIPPGTHSEAIAHLPVAALRLEENALELLARLGVETVGALIAMPRAPLARRFGENVIRRIDQASGALPEPLDPVIPPLLIMVERRFAEPIATAEAIGHWLAGLTEELATALAQAGLGARAVMFVAQRVDSSSQTIRIGLARASREPAHLLRLIARRIEEVDPGYGIDVLALHLLRGEPLGPESLGAALDQAVTPDLAPLVDTLANRIGGARLWRHAPVESDVPERSVAPCPPLDAVAPSAKRPRRDDIRQLDQCPPDHPWHPRWPRPVLLLRRPERIDHVLAELPDHHPRRFTWRGVTHRVVQGDGPERITGEWWRRSGERDAVRDYFRVEDDAGRRFWLFRRGDATHPVTGDLSWYIHGTFA